MTGSNSSRKVPIHRGACPRKSCKRLEQAHYILCSCLFLTAGHDNLLASLPDPLGYLLSEDGESIQQELTLNEAQKTRRSVRSFGRRKIRNAVHTSISNMYPSTPHEKIQRLMIMKQMPPSTHGAHEQQSTLEALCYKHLFELYKLLHGAFLSIGFPQHWHFHPYYLLLGEIP